MRRVNLLRSTAFRLVIIVASLFLIAFFLASIITYRVMSTELETWQHHRIQETFALISASATDSDTSEIIEAVEQHAQASKNLGQIYLLLDARGNAVAGNIPAQSAPPTGWSTLPGSKFGFDADIPYRLYRDQVGDFSLTVGLSGEQISEIKEIVLDSFGWASFMVIALAIVGGGIIATRTQKRLDTVRETMNEIASGRLGARIPATRSDDDIAMLSRDINIALERLSALVEGMKQVSTDIAHDLKTPLNRLKILINSAADRHSLGANVEDELEAAEAESNNINATFDALLRIAQLETGARRARFSPVAAPDILRDVCEVYEDVAEDSGMRLTTDIPPGPAPAIQGDRELLTQLFANLIENALRHCPSGTEIHCSSSQTALHNVIRISDNGQGIPASERENVLRRLYRLEKSRTTDGTGLGLSMVKAISDLHGAELRLSDNQPGLRIEIAFPIVAT